MSMLTDRIYLIGFMGSGKTTLGKKLARELQYGFVDLDDFFEERYKIEIHDFFGKYDEPLFRKLENQNLEKTFSMKKVVIATGGGTPCYYKAIDKINENGCSIYLEMNPAALTNRLISAKRIRPLILNKSKEELQTFISLKLNEREPFYKKARLIVNGLSVNAKELSQIITELEK